MCGMDYSHELNLIATGSRDSVLKIWDYERCKLEVSLQLHTGEIVLVAAGSSARQTVITEGKPVDTVIMAIVDILDVDGKIRYKK